MIRILYERTMALAAHRRANWALAAVSFIESSIFPIPPDVLLIPMVLARRNRWIGIATICTLASVAGAFAGYAIGAWFMAAIGEPLLALYGQRESFARIEQWYHEWGAWGILFGAMTPFPYKVLTIFSGAVGFDLVSFTLVSLVGRGLRFFVVAWLLYRFGEPMRIFIEKRLGLLFTLALILLIGGFAAVRLVF